MTEPSATARYRLSTFGTLALAASDDPVLGAHRHHHRRLALLAVLAAAGEQGRSRDQLLLLFWPEATQSQARHSLDQLLYALRSSLGESAFLAGNPLRLNPDVISSDVGAFSACIARGDLESAVQEYRGPFLDGFYISDAPEFERWLEAERARLAARCADALERLARCAESAQDHAAAERWWRRLAEGDPVSSKNAAGLIRTLMNTGNDPAALQYAERYEAFVARELGAHVGQTVAALVAEARARANTTTVAASNPPLPRTIFAAVPIQLGEARIDQPAPRSDRHHGPRLLLTAAAVVLFAATALGAWWDVASHTAASPADTSLAVLPLVNVSRDPQDAAFVDSLTEDLIGALTKVPGLRVISPTSAFAFRNSDLGVRRIADSLGVSNVLEGSAQRVGAQLRIRLRLVDARDGSTRWSETYDREMRDVSSVQSDVAGGVARELNLRLGGSTLGRLQRRPTSSIAAYELYVRGNDPVLTRSDSGARAGLEFFRQAIALDPRYAAAYGGVARMQIRLAFGGDDTTMSRRDRVAVAEDAARKAVALDDADGDAHASLGFIYRHNYDFASAEVEMKRAVALEPTSARFREWLAQLYVFTDRPAEALAEAHEALRLDPLSPTANAEVARALLANDRCDESLAQLGKLRYLRPPLLRAGSIAAQCYARMGKWQEAVAVLARNSANAGVAGRGFFGYMLARAGRTDEARRILADLREHSRGGDPNTFAVAAVYAGLGERDAAFRWLERTLDERELDLEQLDAVLDGLRPDPRVEQLRERMGLQKR